MLFGAKILEYKDDILRDLDELVRIESVSRSDDCAKALDWILKKADSFGLVTQNVESKAGHAELGDGGLLCATLTHLDVVSAGDDWDYEPFMLTRADGRLYGRGVADDKGAALITLYCLMILKQNNIVGKNTLRAIFGTDEEAGMTDMSVYFGKEKMPDMSFTPDSQYGICRSEKGIVQLEICCDRSASPVLTKLVGGTTKNAVADHAYAVLNCTENDDHQLMRLANAKRGEFEFSYTIEGMRIERRGKAAHACEPKLGQNAILDMVELLSSNFSLSSLGNLCSLLATRVRQETDGTSLGMKIRDSQSGALTVCVSMIEINDKTERAVLDIRYPVTFGGKEIIRRVKKAAEYEKLNVKVLSHLLPLYLADDTPVISLLSEAYEAVMGEKPELYATGGGTYARKLGGSGVAFGPVFGDDNARLHTANESLDEKRFFEHAQICLEAMYRMFTA